MLGDVEALRAEVARLGRIERRMELLLAMSGELSGARTSEDVARIAIDQGIAAVGASYGALWAIDRETTALQLLGVSKLPRVDVEPWRQLPLVMDAPVPEAARTGEPVFVDSLREYAARFPASLDRIRDTISSPDAAYAAVPVAADGQAIAVLALTFEHASALDPGERTFLGVFARQCGLALARVRLTEQLARTYAEEREAHLAADEATRAREEILAVVSHDLRNPLGTILIGASTLLAAVPAGDPRSARVHTIAERIQRQSERMARLIADLVDFAGIQAGELAISRAPHAPEAIIAAAAELAEPFVRERGIAFVADAPADLPAVDCDAERAVQALANLVTNAVKVTPKSGAITIGARHEGGEVVFYVRDTGPGLAPDELPRVFDLSWRSRAASYRGAGLRLSIAKGIVDAHGGRIWVSSRPGDGSLFELTLAPAISRTSPT